MNRYLYELINSAGTLSVEDIFLRIGASIVLGIVVFISYRLTHSGSIYSVKFNITLLTLTILTTMVMTVIGNNVALSLGMVGALSIIRFRTSIKDSRDTIYIFWTIIIGICCGVGDFVVAAMGSASVFLVLMLFGRVKNENRMLLIVRAERSVAAEVRQTIFRYFLTPPTLKAENTTAASVEFIYEFHRKDLDKAQKREQRVSAEEERAQAGIEEKLYALGQIEYVNIISQSDEIS